MQSVYSVKHQVKTNASTTGWEPFVRMEAHGHRQRNGYTSTLAAVLVVRCSVKNKQHTCTLRNLIKHSPLITRHSAISYQENNEI